LNPDQILASLSQLDHQKRPVTRVAILFFTLVCLSLGGMQAWSVYRARQVKLSETTTATANITQTMSEHAGNALNLADLLLSDLVERIEAEGHVAYAARLDRFMADRVARNAVLADLAVYNEDGELALDFPAQPPASPSLAGQLRRHRSDAGNTLFISGPAKHPVSGEWVLPLSRRVSKSDGTFGGVVAGNLRIKVLEDFYAELKIDSTGSLAVVLESGPLVLTRPHSERQIGGDMRRSVLFQAWRQQPSQGAVFRTTTQGGQQVEHLYSYRRLKSYPVLVAVTLPTDQILADWWDSAYLSTAGVSLLMLIQLWLGIRLYGQVALRDRLEKERRSLQKLLVKKSRSLRRQAFKDSLTGIANRRQFDTRLLREFNRCAVEGKPLALIILDVDFFKKYNDEHGHPAGDECLKTVAGCINNGRRRTQDLAARMGGEEFAILLPDTGLRGAIAVAESVRKTVAARTMHHLRDNPHSVTVSCGVHAVVPTLNMAPADLIDAADRALYLAKTTGRNRVRAEGALPPNTTKRFSLVVNK
jgi:diguanylate cyclase (GGDEF)-like protein